MVIWILHISPFIVMVSLKINPSTFQTPKTFKTKVIQSDQQLYSNFQIDPKRQKPISDLGEQPTEWLAKVIAAWSSAGAKHFQKNAKMPKFGSWFSNTVWNPLVWSLQPLNWPRRNPAGWRRKHVICKLNLCYGRVPAMTGKCNSSESQLQMGARLGVSTWR